MELTQDLLHELFEYRDGEIYWKVDRPYKKTKGMKAGTTARSGYRQVCISNSTYLMHRVIFAMHHGYLPDTVDHINGDRGDNRIENLRAANRFENQWNTAKPRNNTSGIKGLILDKNTGKWRAQCRINGKLHIKRFDTKQEAVNHLVTLRQAHQGEFARHA